MLTNNLGLKLLSIISAVMLWLIIVSINDPVMSQDFTGIRVTLNADHDIFPAFGDIRSLHVPVAD